MINAIGTVISAVRSSTPSTPTNNITPDGRLVVGVVGDSRFRGSNNTTGPGPLPTSGTVYQYNETAIIEVGATDLYNCNTGQGTPFPQFGITFNQKTTYKPVIATSASSGSTLCSDGDSNTYDTGGTLYGDLTTRTSATLAALSLNQVYVLLIQITINDIINVQGNITLETLVAKIPAFCDQLEASFPGVPKVWNQEGRYQTQTNDNRIGLVRKAIRDAVLARPNFYIHAGPLSEIGAGGYTGGDLLHLPQSGNNSIGTRDARMVSLLSNTSLGKLAKGASGSMYDDLTETRMTRFNEFFTTQQANGNYDSLETLLIFKTSTQQNIFVDLAFLGFLLAPTPGTFTPNSGITTNGSTHRYATSYRASNNILSTQNDVICMGKIKTRTTASGTVATFFGASDGTNAISIAQASGTTGLIYRVNDNTVSTYAGEAAFASGSAYGVARLGDNKYLLKNNSVVHTAVVPSSGATNQFLDFGSLNNNGTVIQRLAGEFEYFFVAKYSTFNLDLFLNGPNGPSQPGGLEYLIANW